MKKKNEILQESTFYNAGYFIIKKKILNYGFAENSFVSTCSSCINIRVFDYWCLTWMKTELNESEKKELKISEKEINQIREWTDNQFKIGNIKWGNIFSDLKSAIKFKNLFFKHDKDINIYSLYFSEIDANLLLEEFAKGKNTDTFNFNNGELGLKDILEKKIKEKNNDNEITLGYDLIGVECDSSFHTFHCQNIAKELNEKFGLSVNKNGLINNIEEPEIIREYLNNPKNGLEPIPWYIVKVKQIKEPVANN